MKLRLILSLLILSISFGTYAQDAPSEEGKSKKEKTEKAEKEPKEKKEKKPRPPFYDNKLPYIYVGGGNMSSQDFIKIYIAKYLLIFLNKKV